MRYVILLLYVFIAISKSFACGNEETIEPINYHREERTLADGTTYVVISSKDTPYGNPFSDNEKAKFVKAVDKLQKLYDDTNNVDYLSDKGLVLMYLGKYEQAKQIFLDIESVAPNRYTTAANLGTTYELLGDNDNALKWIQKAVAINPQSHKGSEWIHVNILQAKIKGKAFHTSDYILKTSFGNDKIPKSNLSRSELETLHDHILYQLNERVHFIEPKNTIIAELLVALADTAYLLEQYSGAVINYELAQQYGNESKIVNERLSDSWDLASQELLNEKKLKSSIMLSAFLIATLMLLLILLYRLRKRRTGSLDNLSAYPTKAINTTYLLYGGALGTLLIVSVVIAFAIIYVVMSEHSIPRSLSTTNLGEIIKTYFQGIPIGVGIGSIPAVLTSYVLTKKKVVIKRKRDLGIIFAIAALFSGILPMIINVVFNQQLTMAMWIVFGLFAGLCSVIIGWVVLPRGNAKD